MKKNSISLPKSLPKELSGKTQTFLAKLLSLITHEEANEAVDTFVTTKAQEENE